MSLRIEQEQKKKHFGSIRPGYSRWLLHRMCPWGWVLNPKHFCSLLQISILDNRGLWSVGQMLSVTQSQRLAFTHGTPPRYPFLEILLDKERAKALRKWERNVIFSKSDLKPGHRGLGCAMLDVPSIWSQPRATRSSHGTETQFRLIPYSFFFPHRNDTKK